MRARSEKGLKYEGTTLRNRRLSTTQSELESAVNIYLRDLPKIILINND